MKFVGVREFKEDVVKITGDKDFLSISQDKLQANGISCRIVTPQEFLEYVS